MLNIMYFLLHSLCFLAIETKNNQWFFSSFLFKYIYIRLFSWRLFVYILIQYICFWFLSNNLFGYPLHFESIQMIDAYRGLVDMRLMIFLFLIQIFINLEIAMFRMTHRQWRKLSGFGFNLLKIVQLGVSLIRQGICYYQIEDITN